MLTPSQRKSLDLDRNLSVTANAGSGKTFVLVERFVRILLDERAAPEQIVAITFTDKAAAELKSKIAETLESRLQASPDDPRLRELRADVGAAMVGTIHSFCRALLQTYPIEASVDADFTVLDSVEAQYLQQEAIVETFRDILEHAQSDDPLRVLFQRYGRKAIEDIVNLLFDKRELAAHISELYARSDGEIVADWLRVINDEIAAIMRDAPLATLEMLANQRKSKQSEKLHAALEVLRNAHTPRARGAALQEALEECITSNGTIKLLLLPKERISEFIQYAEPLATLKDRMTLFAWDESDASIEENLGLQLRDTRLLLSIASSASERYAAKKEDHGTLDFDDLQMRAVELLHQKDIQAEVHAEYRYVLVDEFQDTNRLQYELLRLLTNGPHAGNLFIVGDPKQSIYGFRNADVGVFHTTREEITRGNTTDRAFVSNGESLESTIEERRGAILLAESFRMLPGIAAFVNRVFGTMMSGDGVGYDPIIANRDIGLMPDAHVEWMHIADRDAEADAVARRIADLIGANMDGVQVDEHGTPRGPEPRDIAVLLRSRNTLSQLEQSLFLHGIPYVVAGGIGFYGRQEILDLCNYLRFLVSPSDDIACAAILRSPYFLVSDAELFSAATMGQLSGTFWEKVQKLSEQNNAPASVREAVALLRRHIAAAHRVTVTELLGSIRVDTLWEGTIAGHPQVAQVRANVEKLVALARNFQSRGFTALYDFVEVLDRLADGAEREGQAPIASDGNVVRVLTVHAAKGLEFPIVFLPFLNPRKPRQNQEMLDSQLGLIFSKRDSGMHDTELFRIARARARRLSDEEERRVFYVAATRAKDALFLSSAGNLSRSSWAGQLARALDEGEPRDGMVIYAGGNLLLRMDAPPINPIAQKKNDDEQSATISGNMYVQPIPSEPYGEFFSASHFVTWRQCPTKYVLRYMLGAPEEYRPRSEPELNGDDRIYGTARGTAAHAVLASIDLIGEDGIMTAAHEEVVKLGFAERDASRLAEDVTQLVRNVFARAEWREVISFQPALAEYELAAAVGRAFVHGVIDRLATDPDGSVHVIDYKTDTINAANASLKAETYALQLRVYAFLVLTHMDAAPQVITHLWFLRAPEHSRSNTFDRSMLPQLREEMERLLGEITAMQQSGTSAVRTLSHCPQCGFHRSERGAWVCSLA